jgi:Rho GTPase-activating protein RGD1
MVFWLTYDLASFNEKLLLSNGLNISPMKNGEQSSNTRSLREAVYAINNEQDLSNYLSSFASKVPPKTSDIKYERNTVRFSVASKILR